MKIAAIQMDIAWEDPSENFRRAMTQLEQAAKLGVRLAVLPEMFATGFSMDAARVAPHAARTRDFLRDAAQTHRLFVAGGYADPATPRPKNAASLFAPDGGEVMRYHKIHPFTLAGEHLAYDGGAAAAVADIEGVRVALVICYDLRFPEVFRAVAERVDLYCVLANWPSPRRHAWRTLLPARAVENQAYVLGINRVGSGDGQDYAGDSVLLNPMGEVLASAAFDVATLSGDVDAAQVKSVRERFSFLADRRPDVYPRL